MVPMIENYEAFRDELRMSKEDVVREVYRQNKDRISIKKEATAVKNLIRIIESTLRLANSKGFHAMTLRDLCADSGMSMGAVCLHSQQGRPDPPDPEPWVHHYPPHLVALHWRGE